MSKLQFAKFSINRFWEKTPTALKYLLVIAIIIAGSYFLITRKVNVGQLKELDKMEQSITVTYDLVYKFDAYQKNQKIVNEQLISDLHRIYDLVNELNDNTKQKFDMLLKSNNSNKQDLIEKLMLLNESFEKLSKAYKPDEKKTNDVNLNKMETPVFNPTYVIRKKGTTKNLADTSNNKK
jgi:hypothetical protein